MALGLIISLTIAAVLVAGIVVLERRDRAVANRINAATDLMPEASTAA
ncbi:MAG: hypothetical protein AAFV19_03870 [Pseudomonadota bacterium]